MDLEETIRDYRRREDALRWEGTFLEYVEIVRRRPEVADLAHARIWRLIEAAGFDGQGPDRRARFFDGDLFGLDRSLREIVQFFSSSARRLEVRKRIVLLMGPVGGGKSTLVAALKRGLESYARTDAGALYGIQGCPMHEEPLHLIPPDLRPQFEETLGVAIEGDLCPVCRVALRERYGGHIDTVKVQRVLPSERDRVAIGTFAPSDPKSQDIAELTGSIDLATIGEYGSESDPRAYRFDGELNVANRGIMEFIEMLKSDERFLYTLLTLSQERAIKAGRFSMIYADEVILAHTNEAEYRAFAENPRNEALKDRIILVKVPYNLRVDEEVRIYQKMIRESGLRGVHLAPHTLQVAAQFAVLSRLKESKRQGLTPVKKMKLLNGEEVEGFHPGERESILLENPDEGMDGISPRYVVNRLSAALVRDGATCLFPIDALRSLKEGLRSHTSIAPTDADRLENLIYEVKTLYDEVAKGEVQKAFVRSFEDAARALFKNYLDQIEAYARKIKVKDPLTGEEVEPDEAFMRAIEEQIGVTDNGKKAFREEILIRLSSTARRGVSFDYTSHERLREAIERKLFADLKNIVKVTAHASLPDPERQSRLDEVAGRLVETRGYCPVCAKDLLAYAGGLLAR